ncbi:type III secretion system translocon subunit SctE [Yersinia hibernica]|uniref:Type III secretion system protein n=1 Tax=Yersinia enterocolitica LC20 TaxID=1443113 RepID=A0A7U4GDY2_YEREN|nr:type III secretion system translocon subunit SctE [Yersinia hibernica]AHM72797.1 type III secretion system protein [Yersinia hibernica]OVZ78271.1 type III secretion system protein [Yersinia kristensenii]
MEIIRQVARPAMLEPANQEPVNHHQAGLESGDVELKKQIGQAKRLGNAQLKDHPQLNSVKGALQTLQPDQLLKLLKSTINTVNGNTPRTNLDSQEMPQLKPPVSDEPAMAKSGSEAKLSASAWATALLGKVMQLTTETSMSNLLSQLQGINAMMGGAASAYSEMASQLEQQGTQWASDADALKAAQQQADTLSQDISKAQAALSDAQKKMSALEAEAAKQDPVSEELQGKIDAAKTAVVNAQANLAQATSIYNNFANKTLNPAINAEKGSRSALEAAQIKSQKLVESFNPQQQSAIEQQRKQNAPESKTLTFLMALMSQLINKSSSDDLLATAELKQKLAEAAAKDAEKKAQEYEQEVRKAEEMQKTMGCIGKVLGWIVTAVSFAAAAFTGGASLALAAVGLALAIGDEISQAVSGRSFMADAMQPLMDAIVKPLMEMMGKMFSAILQAYGVDKETADMVGQILGAIAAAAVLVAGVMVAGSVMSKLFGVLMKKIGADVAQEAGKTMAKNVAVEVEKEVVKDVTKNVVRTAVKEVAEEVAQEVAEKATKSTMQRLMDSALGQVLKRLSKGLGRSLGADELQMAKVSNYSQKAVVGLNVVNTSSQAAVGIVAANMLLEASKIRAEMMKDAALQDLLNEMMTRAIDSFTHRMETVNEIVRNIAVVAENQAQAGKYITKQMSAVAG